MRKWRTQVLACSLLAALVGIGPAAIAGEPAGGPEGVAPKPVLTPEQKRAQELLKHWKDQLRVQREEKRHRAKQHLSLGKDQFEMAAFKDALASFQKAVDLDPSLKEAQQYLGKCKSMLGVADRRAGDWADEYRKHRAIAIEVQKTELANMLAQAKALYDRGEYPAAIEAFTRVAGKAKFLSPRADVGKTAEEAELYTQKALAAMREREAKVDKERLAAATRRTKELRDRRAALTSERHKALLNQARVLFEQHRYEEARKVCEQILRDDPTNGAAETLRQTAVEATRSRELDQALKARRVETERHWQGSRALCVPQYDLVYMPRERFEQVRKRSAASAIGGKLKEPEPWERRIREAMGKKISFDFVETPLQDVISFIGTLVDVTIVLDREAIRDEPPSVTLKVNDMRLEAALNWVLKLSGLKYTLKDEAIFISKPDRIHDDAVLRMYDVTDLTIDIKNFQGRQQALASDGGYTSTGGSGGGGGDDMGEDFFGDEDEEEEEDRLTGDTLVEFIKRTIAPGTWADDADLAGPEEEF